MAAKVNMLKLLQEIRGFAEVANRRPPPRFPGVSLMQMRALGAHNGLRRRKLSVTIDKQNSPDVPHPVKIHHVRQSPDPVTRVSAS